MPLEELYQQGPEICLVARLEEAEMSDGLSAGIFVTQVAMTNICTRIRVPQGDHASLIGEEVVVETQ